MTALAQRSRLAVLIAACLVVLLVLGAVGLGLRLPGLGFLNGPLDRTRLDYQSRFVDRYAPLRDGFVDARLGGSTRRSIRGSVGGAGTIAAAGPSSAPPPLSIQHKATNDAFANAYEVPSIPVTVRTTTSKATRQRGEPGDCSPVGGTVWYRFTPARDMRLIADTFGTRYSDSLAVFSGSRLTDLRQVACDKGATGNAQVSYLAHAGLTHYLQVTGVAGGGLLTFNLQPLGTTERIDASPSDVVTTYGAPAVSENGKYIAFVKQGPPCADEETCIFIRDVEAGRTTLLISTDSGPKNSTADATSDIGISGDIDISGDGQTIAFSSAADNFVRGDNNGVYDVFVIDRVMRRIERVSVTSTGGEAKTPLTGQHRVVYPVQYSGSVFPSLSWDGRSVSFTSDADNLDPRARSGFNSIYVHDRRTGRTELASVDTEGEPIPEVSSRYGRGLSGDGRRVVFYEPSGVYVRDRERRTTTYLGAGGLPVISNDGRRVAHVRLEPSRGREVIVHDLESRKSTVASVSSDGTRQAAPTSPGIGVAGTSTFPRVSLSSDGRYVTFESAAPRLVPKDTNGLADVFVHDLTNRTTTLVSIRSDGSQFSEDSYYPSISGDGRIVAFQNNSSDQRVYVHTSAVAGRP